MPDLMPTTFRKDHGKLKIRKGKFQTIDNLFNTWEIIPDCNAYDPVPCVAVGMCHHDKSVGAKCGVQTEYMEVVTEIIVRNFKEELSEGDLYRVGMHLIPMYNVLCKLKIAMVGVIDPVVTTARGSVAMHPIFKEFRQQIKAIEDAWRSIGISEFPDHNGKLGPYKEKKKRPPLGVPMKKAGGGHSTYYSKMEAEAMESSGLDKVDNGTPS